MLRYGRLAEAVDVLTGLGGGHPDSVSQEIDLLAADGYLVNAYDLSTGAGAFPFYLAVTAAALDADGETWGNDNPGEIVVGVGWDVYAGEPEQSLGLIMEQADNRKIHRNGLVNITGLGDGGIVDGTGITPSGLRVVVAIVLGNGDDNPGDLYGGDNNPAATLTLTILR